MKSLQPNIDIYVVNDPNETLDVLTMDSSPLKYKFEYDGGVQHFFTPKDYSCDPIICFSPPNPYIMEDLDDDNPDFKLLIKEGFKVRSEISYTCFDAEMTENERNLLENILLHLGRNKQGFAISGMDFDYNTVFVGAYNPKGDLLYKPGNIQVPARIGVPQRSRIISY